MSTDIARRYDVLTIFPGIFRGPLDETILRRALDAGLVEIALHDLRDWTHDRHRTVDDYTFGGGPGMVLKPEPIFEAVEAIQPLAEPSASVVLLTPQGRRLDRDLVAELAALPRLLLICGRYEGVDERVRTQLVDLEVSVADVVLSGGELPALLLLDALVRQIPGVLGGDGSLAEESFEGGLAGVPAVHPSRRVSRVERPGRAALRPPRRDRALAARAAPAAHPRTPPRPARRRRPDTRGARPPRSVGRGAAGVRLSALGVRRD